METRIVLAKAQVGSYPTIEKMKRRNPYVLPMTLRNKKQVFHDRREERGGSKNLQQSYLDEDDLACVVTFDQIKERLESLEKILAQRFGILENVRATLVVMDITNTLVEDEVVAEWHSAYSSYLNSLRHQKCSGTIKGTFLLCGEGGNFCSLECEELSKQS